MIHTKSLIRRLAYVPWLLAFGLVLGWAGEAQAQNIRLTVDKDSIREDGGAATITVTATNYTGPDYATKALVGAVAPVDKAKYVILTAGDDSQGLNVRYTIATTTIMIPHDKNAATGEITITPIVDAAVGDPADLVIQLNGVAGNALAVESNGTTAQITLVDKDQTTDQIHLSFDPPTISMEAGPTTITVKATVDGEVLNKALSFPLIVRTSTDADLEYVLETGFGNVTAEIPPVVDPDSVAVRDTDYIITGLGNLIIPRRKVSGSTTFTIDPKGTGNRWVGIGTTDATDLRYSAVSPPAEDDQNDGETDPPSVPTTDEAEIEVVANSFTITTANVAAVKSETEGLAASPASIREEAGSTEIELTVTLKAALTDNAPVDFAIDTEAGGAARDVNYTASFGDLTITAGELTGKTTMTLTPVNNTGTNPTREITIKATVGATVAKKLITITDDDTPTSSIKLTADPAELSEDAGESDVTITATLDGKVFDDDLKLTLVLDGGSATRDVDYTAIIRSLTIDAGAVSGSTTISITPVDDGVADPADGVETVLVKSITELKDENDEVINVGAVTGSADTDDLLDNRARSS